MKKDWLLEFTPLFFIVDHNEYYCEFDRMLDWMPTASGCLPVPNVDFPELWVTETIAVTDTHCHECVWSAALSSKMGSSKYMAQVCSKHCVMDL